MEHSQKKQELKELPVNLKLDLYVEVVIASLIEEGKVDKEKLYIRPKGTFYRGYQPDLAKVDVLEDKNTQELSVYIDVNREGIYDMLPEGLFHKNLRKTRHVDTQESVQELKMHQEEEKHARKFFLPLEQMFYQQRIAIEIEEQKSLIGLSETIVDELITHFWEIPSKLDYYQSLCMAYMLPMMHRIVGDLKLTEQCLEILLQAPVHLSWVGHAPDEVNLATNQLGVFTLGDDFLLNDLLVAELDLLHINVGPLLHDQISDFLAGGRREEFFHLLISYFIPASIDWKLEIVVDPGQKLFQLGSDSEKGILNYTTIL